MSTQNGAHMSYGIDAPHMTILVGACGFIAVLAITAVWQADIRWLHFFQAWIYVALLVLGLKRNRWGYFIGISSAGLWAYGTLFVNGFVRSGLHYLTISISAGHLQRPDQIIALGAWGSNMIIVIGCLWAYLRQRMTMRSDVFRFLATFATTTGFFALDMWLFQPRYLSLFPRLLHPHWP